MTTEGQEKSAEKERNRVHRVTVRFTPAEFVPLQKAAAATASGELADYIRRVLFRRKIEAFYRNRSMDDLIQELSLMRRELNAVGNNFNQITKKVNATAGKKEFYFWVEHAASMQLLLQEKIGAIQKITEQFAAEWYAK